MGVIARDFTRKFIAASCKELHFVTDTMMEEAYALREGISMAQYLGCNNFIIQSDNVLVIETMLAGGFSSTSSATIFDDCRILSTGFRKITFQHCYRKANEVIDELARHSSINHIDCFWDTIP
jgi:ribonuclease HI